MVTLIDLLWGFSDIFKARFTTGAKLESKSFLLPGLRSPSRFLRGVLPTVSVWFEFCIAFVAYVVLILLENCYGLKFNLEC